MQQNVLLAKEVRDRTRERDQMWQLSRDLMVVCDFATRPVAVNPAWTEMLGWTEAELLARPVIDLVHPDDKDKLRDSAEPGANNTMRVEAPPAAQGRRLSLDCLDRCARRTG